MEDTRYGLRVEIPVGYDRALEPATAALKERRERSGRAPVRGTRLLGPPQRGGLSKGHALP
jgi:hypothetical protein